MVDKPHGIHSQPPASGAPDSVLTRCQTDFGPGVRLVHRLDRDASGLMVLARTPKVAGLLGAALEAHDIQREYRARIAVPLPIGTKGTIDAPLKWGGGRTWVDPAGAPSTTHWEVVEHRPDGSELAVRLETGRMHQIRVHLAHRLGPILGDRKYRGPRAERLYLRAVRLCFKHPESGLQVTFEVPGFG